MTLQIPLRNPVFKSCWISTPCVRLHPSSSSAPRSDIRHSTLGFPSRFHVRKDRRLFHATSSRCEERLEEHQQAVPLGDFYTDLLSKPLPKRSDVTSALPTFVPAGDESKEERARKLFGTMEGSRYQQKSNASKPDATWRTVNGVPVPPKPTEPDNCCMSGCVHCVWDDYRDDVESWAARLQEAQAKSPHRATDDAKASPSRPELQAVSRSMDDDGGGSEALWDGPSTSVSNEDALFESIPVGIREFMATEKRIRDRKRSRKHKGLEASDYL